MGTTNQWPAIPYPEPTAPVRDGAANMRAIAERVQTLLANALPYGLGIRGSSSVVTLDANGAAIIPISPAFVRDLTAGLGSITVGIEGGGGQAMFITGLLSQQWKEQWTVMCRTAAGGILTGGPYRINWVGIGYVN